jgi:uncharacterized membrane protein
MKMDTRIIAVLLVWTLGTFWLGFVVGVHYAVLCSY